MNSRERVLAALNIEKPDRVPYCELLIDEPVARQVIIDDRKMKEMDVATFFHCDNVACLRFGPPVYGKWEGNKYIGGVIKSRDDLKVIQLPDPNEDSLYQPAIDFLKENNCDLAIHALVPLALDPVMRNTGFETFCELLHDDPYVIESMLDKYSSWMSVAVKKLGEIGFDFLWLADDIAYKTGPMFSPKLLHDLIMPYYERVAKQVQIPWVFHSDGNIQPLLDDLLTLKMSAIHPFEPGAMDPAWFKKEYGKEFCMIGNIDLNTLTLGTPKDVEMEVKERIEMLAEGGGYICSSANSIADYCKAENVLAISEAIRKYGKY